MKIKAIASLCKKQKRVHIYNIENRGTIRQFVGDGYACYPIDGMPKVDEKTILAISTYRKINGKNGWYLKARNRRV